MAREKPAITDRQVKIVATAVVAERVGAVACTGLFIVTPVCIATASIASSIAGKKTVVEFLGIIWNETGTVVAVTFVATTLFGIPIHDWVLKKSKKRSSQ